MKLQNTKFNSVIGCYPCLLIECFMFNQFREGKVRFFNYDVPSRCLKPAITYSIHFPCLAEYQMILSVSRERALKSRLKKCILLIKIFLYGCEFRPLIFFTFSSIHIFIIYRWSCYLYHPIGVS